MDDDQPRLGDKFSATADRVLSMDDWHTLELRRIFDAMADLSLHELTIKRTDA